MVRGFWHPLMLPGPVPHVLLPLTAQLLLPPFNYNSSADLENAFENKNFSGVYDTHDRYSGIHLDKCAGFLK